MRVVFGVLRNALAASAVLVPLYFYTRYRRALRCKCDLYTAYAKLPPGAYDGKIVWITGASMGVGAEFARQLGTLGAKLILSARSEHKLAEVKDSLVTAGTAPADVVVLPLDNSDLSSIPAAATRALACFGGVDVLINNAGFTQRELACNTDFEVMEHLTVVDYLSSVRLAKQLLAPMEARGGGRIINNASLAGKCGMQCRTAYCGAKAALVLHFDALRVEEHARGSGIAVTNICTGSIKTDVARNAVLGAKGALRGDTDQNIEVGLDPQFVVERTLAAAANDLDELWLAQPWELWIAYYAQYIPMTLKVALKKNAKAAIQHTLAAVNK